MDVPGLFDYLKWRGDLSMEQVSFGPVDTLLLSTLCYVGFDDLVPSGPKQAVTLEEAGWGFLALPREEQLLRVRSRSDIDLVKGMVKAPRFSQLRLSAYQNRLEEDVQLQFCAVAIHLGARETFLAYRGTDRTLVGWKEDFNMSFQSAVPAQWVARDYLECCAGWFQGDLILGGHSKGGNLAVFAASMCRPEICQRVKAIYCHDSPGFTDLVMNSPGYARVLPRIHSFIPESSVVGMMLEHQEPYVVVKSRSIGVLQHDPYSWEILGNDFIRLEDVTQGSRVLDQTLKAWLAGMSAEERGQVIDTIYEMLQSAEADRVQELLHPKSLYAILRAIKKEDDHSRRRVADALGQLAKTAIHTVREHRKD